MTIRTRVLILNYHQWLDGGWLWFTLMLCFPIPVSSIYHPSWVGGCASKRGICNGTFAHLPGIDNKRAFHLKSIPHRPRRRQAAQLSSIIIRPSSYSSFRPRLLAESKEQLERNVSLRCLPASVWSLLVLSCLNVS